MKIEEKLIYKNTNEIEVVQVCEILKEHGIPYVKKETGSGQYMGIYMGQSWQEKEIYVSDEDYEKAKQLIDNFVQIKENNTEGMQKESKEQEEIIKEIKKYRYIKYALVAFIFGLPLIAILCVIIAQIG